MLNRRRCHAEGGGGAAPPQETGVKWTTTTNASKNSGERRGSDSCPRPLGDSWDGSDDHSFTSEERGGEWKRQHWSRLPGRTQK